MQASGATGPRGADATRAAGSAGAVLLSSTGSSVISATNFSGNTASGLGGGLLLLQGDLLLNNTLWSNNSARVSGGAVAALQQAGQALVLSSSRFEGNAAASAGAVFASQATMAALPGTSSTSGTLGETLLSANDSAVARAGSAAMRSSLWQFASYGGAWLDLFHLGAASVAGSDKAEQLLLPKDTLLGLYRSTLVGNEASNATGAAVQAAAGVVLAAAGSTLSGNSAVQHGGALACESCKGLLLLACNLTGNRAAGSGGAVYSRASRGRVDLRSVTMSGNAAEVAGGAACLLATADDVIVSNSVVVNNTAGPLQGADTSADQASNSTAAASCAAEGGRGRASGCGGGLCVQPLSAVLVTESRIAGNSAAIGGGVLVEACSQGFGTCPVLLMNSSVELNAAVVGGGLYSTDARAVAVQGCGSSGNDTAADAGTMLVLNGSALGTSANSTSGSGTVAAASNSSSSWVEAVLSALEDVVPVTSVFHDSSAGLAAAPPAGAKSAAYLAPFSTASGSSGGLLRQGACIAAWGSNRAQGTAGYGAAAAGTAAYLVANMSSEQVLLLSRNSSVAVQVGGWHGAKA